MDLERRLSAARTNISFSIYLEMPVNQTVKRSVNSKICIGDKSKSIKHRHDRVVKCTKEKNS